MGDQSDKRAGKLTLTLPSTGSGRSGSNASDTAYFLCDVGSYMLGIWKFKLAQELYKEIKLEHKLRKEFKSTQKLHIDRIACVLRRPKNKKFKSAKKLHTELLKNIDVSAARAITAYFNAGIPKLPPNIDEKTAALSKFIFMVDRKRVDYDDCQDEIRNAWETRSQDNDGQPQKLCLVTGKYDNIIKLHYKIELRGVTMSKQPLISMNDQTSFRSYGKNKDDPPAEIGKKAAFAYFTALNGLLRNENNHKFIGGDTLVYWSEDGGGEEENVFSWTSEPKESDTSKLAALMERAALGKRIAIDGCKSESRFYLLCLSPNGARISVRFFHIDTFGAVLSNNLRHYRDLEIVKAGNDKFKYPPPWMLLSETTVKRQASDAAPLLGGQLMRSIILGERYPMTLYNGILARIRAGAEINKTKAAIIKAVLIRNYNESEVTKMSLNSDSTNIPYVLGRLFSVLERLQEKANGSATIRERYFTSACANPRGVFPTLLTLSMHHSAKLDNATYLEKLKTDLLGRIDVEKSFPVAQNLDDQGRFILGYYHQTQNFFTSKKDKGELENE